MIHSMRLATEYFEKIKDGTKTIECRLYDEKRRELVVGDEIEFTDANNETRKVKTRIIALHQAPSFADLISRFPLESVGSKTAGEFLEVLAKFYHPEDERKFGVVGIEITLV